MPGLRGETARRRERRSSGHGHRAAPLVVRGEDAARALGIDRARQQEALAELATELLEERQLRAGLDPFGVDRLVERLGELEDRADDLVAFALAAHLLDERA